MRIHPSGEQQFPALSATIRVTGASLCFYGIRDNPCCPCHPRLGTEEFNVKQQLRHSGEGRNPAQLQHWTPASAGVTVFHPSRVVNGHDR